MDFQKHVCEPCGYIYDPVLGDADADIAPGTPFKELPEDWVCPICGLGKEVFAPIAQKKSKGQVGNTAHLTLCFNLYHSPDTP